MFRLNVIASVAKQPFDRRMRVASLLMFLAMTFFFAPFAMAQEEGYAGNTPLFSPEFKAELPLEVNETSGLFFHNGRLWTHNDSGGKPILYGLDTATFEVVQRITLVNAKNKDWEDVCTDGKNVYVGDFGNNKGKRKNLRIFVFPVSAIPSKGDASITVDSICFSFADQTSFDHKKHEHDYDCEAMFATDEYLYLFSKGWATGTTRLYRLSKTPGEQVAEVVNNFDSQGMITGADYDRENGTLVVVGYVNKVWLPFLYLIYDFDDAGVKLSNHRFELHNYIGTQAEGVCFYGKGKCYLSAETSPAFSARVFTADFQKRIAKEHPKKAVKAYEAAQKAYSERDYQKALEQLQKALEKDPEYAEAWLLQGEIGMETRDYDLAMEGYEQSLKANPMLFPPAALTLAGLYDKKMRYAEEVAMLEWFQKQAPGNKANDEKAARMLVTARFRKEAVSYPVDFNPVSLGSNVNTLNDEYVNALELTGEELLFTRRYSVEGAAYQREGLFLAHAADGQWFPATQLHVHPEIDDRMGAAFLSYKGDELFFTVCGMDWHNSGCDLYRVIRDVKSEAWNKLDNLGESVNDPAWDSQPCLSLDGKELFFASRRNGNADLYHCYRDENGRWSEPESLGPVINTKGTEMAPFIHPDGKTLYFSSDTHTGMGGYDLFVSRRNEKGGWSEPVNLGYPINTPGDEINFIVAADGHTALISSIREGGFGGYDIYAFQLKDDDLKPESVNVYDYFVEDLKPGTVMRLVNIQFEFGSAALTQDSDEGINMLAAFLESHPDIHVELAGHTDNVGSETYNVKLSEERAAVVRQALISKGIEEERLSAKGYGSMKPIVPNDTDEHRAMNRRTEMIIVE